MAGARTLDEHVTDEPFEIAIGRLIHRDCMSLRSVARALGLDVSYVSRLRSGEAPAPPDATIERFARLFGVSPDYFVEYRIRRVAEWLRDEPAVAAELYRIARLSPGRRRREVRRAREVLAAGRASTGA